MNDLGNNFYPAPMYWLLSEYWTNIQLIYCTRCAFFVHVSEWILDLAFDRKRKPQEYKNNDSKFTH